MPAILIFLGAVLVIGTVVARVARASLRAYRLASAAGEGEVRAWCAGRSREYRFRSGVPIVVLLIARGTARLGVCGTSRTVWVDLDPSEVELVWSGDRLYKLHEPSSGTTLYVRAWRPGAGSNFLAPGTNRMPMGPS